MYVEKSIAWPFAPLGAGMPFSPSKPGEFGHSPQTPRKWAIMTITVDATKVLEAEITDKDTNQVVTFAIVQSQQKAYFRHWDGTVRYVTPSDNFVQISGKVAKTDKRRQSDEQALFDMIWAILDPKTAKRTIQR